MSFIYSKYFQLPCQLALSLEARNVFFFGQKEGTLAFNLWSPFTVSNGGDWDPEGSEKVDTQQTHSPGLQESRL